ncbi:uncharacterized protein FA14DRAFT_182151 [Meira miltonrushii]|uniref:Uncharacterized protein n=1 Tax=Meira miltonrushii TaxID=1280837 RepID=A0A316V6W8_9BASI|nr:uncharacterized protein FA14DRAFT_182151 [Meira miltonrushii]PWN32241.1 hypothetical protein FA14DRAFT_182151 [Meira miltonrushii]
MNFFRLYFFLLVLTATIVTSAPAGMLQRIKNSSIVQKVGQKINGHSSVKMREQDRVSFLSLSQSQLADRKAAHSMAQNRANEAMRNGNRAELSKQAHIGIDRQKSITRLEGNVRVLGGNKPVKYKEKGNRVTFMHQ